MPDSDLIVSVSVVNGTTVDGDFDFSAPETKTQDITILAGQTTASFSVDTADDSVYEGFESYQVQIDSTSGGNFENLSLGTSAVTTFISDNADAPEISISDITVTEDGSADFTVNISNGVTSTSDINFTYSASDGTAISGEDYLALLDVTGTIPAGASSVTINIPLLDDYIADDGETFNVTINAITPNVTVATANATATISDDSQPNTPFDDSDPIESNFDSVNVTLIAYDNQGNIVSSNTVEEGSNAYYKVVLVDDAGNPIVDKNGNPASGNVNITYTDASATGSNSSTTTDGTQDYNNSVTTVAINQVFSVETFNDVASDDNETFTINIVSDTYTGASEYENVVTDTTVITTTITETNIPSYVFVDIKDDVSVVESDGALLTHTITFQSLDGKAVILESGKQVTVNLVYSPNDTATDADFDTKVSQVVIIGDGGSSYTFSNVVKDDFLKEGSESYTVSIANVSDDNGYFEGLLPFGLGEAKGTITDETTPDTAYISITSDQIITEGDSSQNFIISVDQDAATVTSDIRVQLTYSGVAQDGVDYVGVAEVIILAGTNNTRFSIPTINDKIIEGSEDFTITIGSITDTNFEAISTDSTKESVTNTIIDDVDANPDDNSLKEGGNQVTGNLLVNDEVGVNAQVTGFTYTDESGGIQNGVIGTEADTQYGRILVNANGSYTYYSDTTPENHPSDGNTDTAILPDIINYTLTDDNGDIDSSTLTLNVSDTIGSVTDGAASSVNEDDLADGSDTSKESLVITNIHLGINASTDGVESITFNLSDVQAALSNLTSHGVALTYTLSSSDQVLTASAGATEVFVVTLNQAGVGANPSSYDFELKAVIDHLNSSGGKLDSLDIKIPFQYKEIGATEDTVKGNLTVNVVDDTPTAVVDAEVTVVEGTATPITANVLTNDVQGADGALVHDFKYTDASGTLQDKYFSDTVSTYTVDTPTGSLTINQDGSWSFTAHTYVDHDDAVQGTTHIGDGSDNDSVEGSFDYRLQDYDTDNSNYVTQVIHVTDGADPSASGITNAVDEDDIVGSGSDQTQSATVSGNLSVTGGSDPIDVAFTTTGSGTLTSNGIAITYILSNAGHTLTGSAGSEVIFIAQVTGDTTVNDPTYSFEIKGSIDHADASGQNTINLPLEYKALDIDGDAVTSNLVVTITDDVPSIGAPVDGAVDESGLPSGATPDPTLTITTGTLAVGQEADSIDTVFDGASIAGLESQNIQATLGNELIYTLSNSGHTLTASFGAKDYFSVDIKNPTSTTASYEFTLINAIHESVSGGTQNINIPFSVSDFDKDSISSSFNVLVTDDTGSGDKQLLVNEDGSIVFSITSDDIEPQLDYITSHGRISFDDVTNLFTYTPDPDYSGVDNGIVLDYVVNGTSHSINVNATIKPIADIPTIEAKGLWDTDEDTVVDLGLIAPVVKDDFDQNSLDTAPNTVSGDNPERLSVISLDGLSNGSTLFYGQHSVLLDGTTKTIFISDLDENGDGVNDHVNGITADFTMTKAEYESMQILPPLNSGNNLHISATVTSYEVDDSGHILTGVSGKTIATNFTIDVHAKTDDGVSISVADISGDEDNWMRIDDAITITKTLDVDGSEVYELVFDGTALPAGTLYYQGTPTDMSDRSIGSDASGGFSISISNIDDFIAGNNPLYIMTPVNDSTDITDLKVTVNVHDTDTDSTPATDVVKSASDYVDAIVVPVANDITVSSSGASGNEDTLIDMNLSFTNLDTPLEKVIAVTISDIPDGAKIYDASGTLVHENNSGAVDSFTLQTPTGDLSAIEGYKILPPAHSSSDIVLQVSMELKDFDDDGAANTDTRTTSPVPISIEVLAVTETDRSDSADPSGADVSIHNNHYYSAFAEEDTYFNLNTADAGFTLAVTNEDDSSLTPYGSESTMLVFTNLLGLDAGRNVISLDNAVIKYNDGTQDIEKTFSNNEEVEVPLAYINTVEIKPPFNYGGTFEVDTFVRTQDSDEDTGVKSSVEESHHSILAINVTPVVDDNPNVNISQSTGNEDDGRLSDGSINAITAQNGIEIKATIFSLDSDGSEKFRVFFDKIPEDAALYYKGHIIYANSGTDFVSDGITITDNGDGTYKAQLEDYNASISAKIIPPHNSDVDITLKASSQTIDTATLADGTVVEVVGPLSAEQDVDISIAADADRVVFTDLRTFDVAQESAITSGDQFSIDEKLDGSGSYNMVVKEDSASSGVGAKILLSELFVSPSSIDSYDNIYSNKIDISPIRDSSVASENVTITLSNLGADFDVSGASLIGGSGTSRVWSFTLAQLTDVKITTPKHFSGEVDFDVKFISGETSGNAKENPLQNIKVLVTPVAENLTTVPLESLDVNEDVLESTYIGFAATLPDDNGNPEHLHDLWIKADDITNKEFTLFYDDGSTKYNEVTTTFTTVTLGGLEYYYFDQSQMTHLYIQYGADLGTSTDTDVNVKLTLIDYIDLPDGQTIANISPVVDKVYSINLHAITDDINATTDVDSAHLSSSVTDAYDSAVKNAEDDISINVVKNTDLMLTVDIAGVDMPNEVDITNPPNTPNTPDDDGSEQIIKLKIEGVPKGISIDGGYYAGDIEDPNNPGQYTGIWYVENPTDPNGDPMVIDGDGTSYELGLTIGGDNTAGHEISGDITVSFINQDGGAATTADSVSIHLSDTGFSPTDTQDIPMDILEWDTTGNESVIVEDTPIALGQLVNFSVDDSTVGAGTGTYNGIAGIADGTSVTVTRFSITLEGLANATVSGTGWNEDSSTGTTFWTYQGDGKSNIQTALDNLIITPNKDYNQNHDQTNPSGDTSGVFNEGPLQFSTTLTTYANNGFSDVQSLDYSGNVEPVTDDFDLNETLIFTDEDGNSVLHAQENGKVAITGINISSVDSPYGTVVSGDDITITNVSVDNSAGESMDAKVTYTDSSGNTVTSDFKVGDSITVTQANKDSVVFELYDFRDDGSGNERGKYLAGDVKLEYAANVQEKGSASASFQKGYVDFYVNPVAAALNITHATFDGNEDNYIELLTAGGDSFDVITNLVDPTETLSTLVVGHVPNGYLVFYGDDTSSLSAANIVSVDAFGFVEFTIPPGEKVWLRPPENVGGESTLPQPFWDVIDAMSVKVGVDDMGVIVFNEKPVLVTVNAIADSVSITPANASGVEGSDIALNFNTTVIDTDKSEQLVVTLAGLGADAVFKLSGKEIDLGYVTYDKANDIYTIDAKEINYTNLSDLTFIQNNFSGDVTTTVVAKELSNADTFATPASATFNVNITQQDGTAGDDTLFFDKTNGNDGFGGNDTLVFGFDYSQELIDFTTLDDTLTKNIEVLDLVEHGNHNVNISATDVEAMSDANNTVIINSDSGDSVSLANSTIDPDDVWAQVGTTDEYESAKGAHITINGAAVIGDALLDATPSDDLLGYNDTKSINAGFGDDRLIIFDTKEVDFSKVSNVETIDYSVVGDHTVTDLTLSDVIDVTDSNNCLKILGDTADNVDFDAADKWVKNDSGQVTEDGKTFDVYTSSNDATVEVKVQVEVNDSI